MPSPAVPQTNKLTGYSPKSYPTLPDMENIYFTEEFRKIHDTLTTVRQVMVQLEARIKALGG